MRVKVSYTYTKLERITVEMPDGIEPSEILRLATAEAREAAPDSAKIEQVTWLTATKPPRFGGTI